MKLKIYKNSSINLASPNYIPEQASEKLYPATGYSNSTSVIVERAVQTQVPVMSQGQVINVKIQEQRALPTTQQFERMRDLSGFREWTYNLFDCLGDVNVCMSFSIGFVHNYYMFVKLMIVGEIEDEN